jgi:hypothetical protein
VRIDVDTSLPPRPNYRAYNVHMAADQKNFENYLYVDDNGVSWTKRGEVDAARGAVDGHATGTGAPTWRDGPRMRARHIIYQDPTTFRTKRVIFYTAAAFSAVALNDIIAFHVEGETTTVNYNAVQKVAEKQPGRGAARQLADHA